MIKLSVIVTAYNEVEYIDETIASILSQHFDYDYEIIIGDDGSDDGTIQKIIEYQKKYPDIISYFVMERDNSPVVASVRVSNVVRRALGLAKGEYISLVAGDDFYYGNDRFATQIAILENSENRDCVGCAGYWYKWYNDNNKLIAGDKYGHLDIKCTSRFLWEARLWIHVSAFTFRNVFKNSDTPVQNLLIDDTGFTAMLGQYGKFYICPKPVLCYRQRPQSIMATHNRIQFCWVEMCLMEDVMKNIPELKHYCFVRFYKYIGYMCLFENRIYDLKYKKFIDLYMSICKDNPKRMFGSDIKKTPFRKIKLFTIAMYGFSIFMLRRIQFVFFSKLGFHNTNYRKVKQNDNKK